MTYSTTGRPHALETLNTGSETRTFTYNLNGGMTGGQVDSATRAISWTSYDLPASITIGTLSRTFSYGADRQRYKQVSVSGTTRTYTYAGEHYVKEEEGASTEYKLYIYANGEQVGYVSDDGTPDVRYFHKDHLGSITTIVTNQNIAGREKLSYDAWGKRRSGTDWFSAAATASEERGYTGHEHLDNVNLIHMNGRLLDPKLGRVISADPFVPDPLYSQSFNRYSYVYNNPLRYTDPSGYGACDWFRAICNWVERIRNFSREHPGAPCTPGSCSGGGFGGWHDAPSGAEPYLDAIAEYWAQMIIEQEAQAQVDQDMPASLPTTRDFPAEKTDQEGVTPSDAHSVPDEYDVQYELRHQELLEDLEQYLETPPAPNDYEAWFGYGVGELGLQQKIEDLDRGWECHYELNGCDAAGFLAGPEVLAGFGLRSVVQNGVRGVATRIIYRRIGSTGRVGEEILAGLGGTPKVFFPTSTGARFVDQLVNGIAHESKVGYMTLTRRLERQIAKDAELIANRDIAGATWHFFKSPVTGLGGPSGSLRAALQRAGIKIVEH